MLSYYLVITSSFISGFTGSLSALSPKGDKGKKEGREEEGRKGERGRRRESEDLLESVMVRVLSMCSTGVHRRAM